jgi:hypothetical protein
MFLIGRPVYWFLTPDPWEKLARFEAFVFYFGFASYLSPSTLRFVRRFVQ